MWTTQGVSLHCCREIDNVIVFVSNILKVPSNKDAAGKQPLFGGTEPGIENFWKLKLLKTSTNYQSGLVSEVKPCKKWLAATHETENGKSLQGRLCSLSTACFSSNQSMFSVPVSLLLSFENLHIETE